jgi:hypothetical protein
MECGQTYGQTERHEHEQGSTHTEDWMFEFISAELSMAVCRIVPNSSDGELYHKVGSWSKCRGTHSSE